MDHLYSSVPLPLIVLAGFILALALGAGIAMLVQSQRVIQSRRRLVSLLSEVNPPAIHERNDGLPLVKLDKLRQKSTGLTDADKQLWTLIDGSLQRYTSPERREGWFLVEDFHVLFPEERLSVGYYHNIYQSIPGILTGLGLLGTFVALLFGLLSLQYTESAVKGLDLLINNLSGKFLTSVIALICSLLFALFEKLFVDRPMTAAYESLAEKCGSLFPILTQTRLLSDIQQSAIKQETSLSNVSSDLVDRFVGVFKAELSPALGESLSQQMALQLKNEFIPAMASVASALQQLQGALERLESQKQDSVMNELRGVVDGMKQAVTASLQEMGAQFHEQLTGAAKGEFGNVQKTLSGTTEMLQQMNSQFELMQKSLTEVIAEARSTSQSQSKASEEQALALSNLMTNLILKLNETADNNVKNVSSALLVVVEDLSKKVSAVSQAMISSVGEAATRSQTAANQVVEHAGAWTETVTKRLEQILSSIEVRSQEFTQAGQGLLAAHSSLSATLEGNQSALDSLADASEQVRTFTAGLAQLTKAAEEIQRQHVQSISHIKSIVQEFKETGSANQELLEKHRTTLLEYTSLFQSLDGNIAATMRTVNEHMQQYLQTVETNFNTIVQVSNGHLPQISAALKEQTASLESQLEELGDVMDRGIKSIAKAATR